MLSILRLPNTPRHSHYMRRLADLPWQGRVVEIRLHARRFRCQIHNACGRSLRRGFRNGPAGETHGPPRRKPAAIGLRWRRAGSRLSHRLAVPVSGDTLLRMIRAVAFEPPERRAWSASTTGRQKGAHGTIICDLERNRILDLLPDRNADSRIVAGTPSGIEVVARDRAGLYADGARRGAPHAMQVADRWHLLQNLGEALRLAVGRHRKAVSAAGKAMIDEMAGNDDASLASAADASTKLDGLRGLRRSQRRELYAEILHLRESGMSPRQIALRIGTSVRTIERWLAAGGEPEHRRPPSRCPH